MAPAKRRQQAQTALDLFSGCGGLTTGLKKAGFRVLGAVEIEETSAETYKLNHPEVHVWTKDIRDLTPRTVTRKLGIRKGQLDLLAGCPPCEGFSTMRTLNGNRSNRDKRNNLLFEFLRFVEALQPKAIMLENVRGLAKNQRFKRFCARLEELGYKGKPDILDAGRHVSKLPNLGVATSTVQRVPEPGRAGLDLLPNSPHLNLFRVRPLSGRVANFSVDMSIIDSAGSVLTLRFFSRPSVCGRRRFPSATARPPLVERRSAEQDRQKTSSTAEDISVPLFPVWSFTTSVPSNREIVAAGFSRRVLS